MSWPGRPSAQRLLYPGGSGTRQRALGLGDRWYAIRIQLSGTQPLSCVAEVDSEATQNSPNTGAFGELQKPSRCEGFLTLGRRVLTTAPAGLGQARSCRTYHLEMALYDLQIDLLCLVCRIHIKSANGF